MKPFTLLFLLALCFCCSVRKNNKKVVFTCEEGIKDAIINVQKGEYLLISYGLTMSFSIPEYSDYGYGDFKEKFIYDKYGIKYENGGCVITKYGDCFREKTEELLFKKYGNNILVRAEKEAINRFKKTKKYEENLKKRIESDHVFPSVILHSKAKFIGGEKELEKYLGRSTNIYEFDWDKEYIDVDFIVEKNGNISDIKITSSIKSKELDSGLKDEIFELIQGMPLWEPAIYFNETVRVSESINIVI